MASQNKISTYRTSEIVRDSDSNGNESIDSEIVSDTSSNGSEYERSRNLNKSETSSEEDHHLLPKKPTHEFIWSDTVFKPQLFAFDPSNSGYSGEPLDNPLAYFELFFGEKLLDTIVKKTNKYQAQSRSVPSFGHMLAWEPTDINEIYVFLAITMIMAHTKKNRISDYWSTDHLISTPIFSQLFSRDRYLYLIRYLHFNNNQQQQPSNRQFKIQPIIEHLKGRYKATLIPYQNLVIDEHLMLWKGRLSFKQYILLKRSRFGVKIHILCDCLTGFVLDFIVYTGSTTEYAYREELGVSGSIVMSLLSDYLDKGHNLYVDNWYSSARLFEELHKRKTRACGTLRESQIGLSRFSEVFEQGQQAFRHTEHLLALKWYDKRRVYMLSTIHTTDMVPDGKIYSITKEQSMKAICIADYNKNSRAVEKAAMQIIFSKSIRKSMKWYKKFFYLPDITVLNAYLLSKLRGNHAMQLIDFRLQIIRDIVQKYGSQRTATRGRPSSTIAPLRLTARHFISPIPATDMQAAPRRKYVVCSNIVRRPRKKDVLTRCECSDCDVSLCLIDCFKDFHTLQNF